MLSKKIKNIVVIKLDHIGDMLWATPALSMLRQNIPQAKITVVCTPYTEPVLRENPNIDAILPFDKNFLRTAREVKTYISQRMAVPDIVLCMDPRDDATYIAYLSRAKVRAGYYLPDKPLSVLKSIFNLNYRLPHPSCGRRNVKLRHEVDVNIMLLNALGMDSNPQNLTKLYINKSEYIAASECLKKYKIAEDKPLIMYHLPLKWVEGMWDKNHLLKIAYSLSQLVQNGRLLVTCGPNEDDLANSLKPYMPQNSITIPSMDFRTWSALVSYCSLVVSRDCGAVHVAAAMHVPVISVFEESKKKEFVRWEPWGVEHVNIIRPANATPESIAAHVREIVEAAAKLLGRPAQKRTATEVLSPTRSQIITHGV